MTLRETKRYLLLGTAVVLSLVIGCLVTVLGASYPLALIALTIGALITVASFFSPRFGFCALLISSMFTRFELPLGESLPIFGQVGIRVDQFVLMPVLAGIAPRLAVALLNWRYKSNSQPRVATVSTVLFVGLSLYIGVNMLSSFHFSRQLTQSLEIVIWLLLSFVAYAGTYFIVGKYVTVREAFFLVLASGFGSAAVGIFLFILFQVTGSTLGIQQDPAIIQRGPGIKLAGTFFEANIFGSFQAFSALAGITVLHLREVRGRAFGWVAIGTLLSVIALALSFTRGAWVGFLAGLLVLIFFQLRGGRFLILLVRLGIFGFATLLALVSAGLLTPLVVRLASIVDFSGYDFAHDTFAFRLTRFKLALDDWSSSPIFGLGTNSFGQRHLDPTQGYAPDYLANLFLAALYDVGLVGLLVLLTVFGVLIGALVRVVVKSRGKWEGGLALALLCGIIGTIVSYQATNAFWFSYNWIIMAIVVRLYESSSLRPASYLLLKLNSIERCVCCLGNRSRE